MGLSGIFICPERLSGAVMMQTEVFNDGSCDNRKGNTRVYVLPFCVHDEF